MTQEWALPHGRQQHMEHLTEQWEGKLRKAFPNLMAVYGRDFFDELWSPAMDDDDQAAFEDAVATVSAEIANAYTFAHASLNSRPTDK